MVAQEKVVLLEPFVRIAAETKRRETQTSVAAETVAPRFQRHLTTKNNNHSNSTNTNNLGAESNWWHLIHYSNLIKWPTFNQYATALDELLADDRYTANSWPATTASELQQLALNKSWQNISHWTQKLLTKMAHENGRKNALLIQHRLVHTTENNLNENELAHFDRLAQLSCDSGEMILRLNFTEPFKGIVYPDHNRLSPCRFFGDGHHNYELRLPLKGCGTRQVSAFYNRILLAVHFR